MKINLVALLSLICLVFTFLWLIFFITDKIAMRSLETFEQVLNYIDKGDFIFYMTYVNAALVTVTCIMLFIALYLYYKKVAPDWATIGVGFVPIYGVLSLIVYLSQVTVVVRLLEMHAQSEYQMFSQLLLRQLVQHWPDSFMYTINNLAYAVLGIPSIIFGIIMTKNTPRLKLGGILLSLNGVSCIVGFIGIVLQNKYLSQGSPVGGVLFFIALFSISWVLVYRKEKVG